LTWVCGREHHSDVAALFHDGVRGRVSLHDWVRQSELRSLYDSHGIYLAHSIYEGAAKACVEAMARGMALVSSRVGALKEHVSEGENGFLVEVGDTDGMAHAAIQLLADARRMQLVGERAASGVRGLSWRACAQSAVRFYQLLLDRQSRGDR
jgi:glycosyltransferase involved in cell wall biosynthesis